MSPIILEDDDGPFGLFESDDEQEEFLADLSALLEEVEDAD